MAFQVAWSSHASQDLEDIIAYISRDSVTYALRVGERILSATKNLQTFPNIGRSVPEFDEIDSIREILSQPYRIIYRIAGQRITIAAVIHGARDLHAAITDRPA